MVTKVFDKPDRFVCLLCVEKEIAALKASDDVFVNKPYPLADDIPPVFYAVVLLDNVICVRRGHSSRNACKRLSFFFSGGTRSQSCLIIAA